MFVGTPRWASARQRTGLINRYPFIFSSCIMGRFDSVAKSASKVPHSWLRGERFLQKPLIAPKVVAFPAAVRHIGLSLGTCCTMTSHLSPRGSSPFTKKGPPIFTFCILTAPATVASPFLVHKCSRRTKNGRHRWHKTADMACPAMYR